MYCIARRSCGSLFGSPKRDVRGSAHDDVRLDAQMVDVAVVRREVARGRDLYRRAVGQRIDRLHDALAEGLRRR